MFALLAPVLVPMLAPRIGRWLSLPPRRAVAGGALAVALLLAAAGPGLALAQSDPAAADPRAFPETGFTVADDAVWTFFSQHGGADTFGAPVSREFGLLGAPTQLFQRAALQVRPDGSVQVLPLPSTGSFLPYTGFNGSTVPATDQALAMVAPSPDGQTYTPRLLEYLRATVPNSWRGQPVGFATALAAAANPGDGTDPLLQGASVWGLPTSAPAADPRNPRLVYQRFQNGILQYDADTGTTVAMPLGEYLKAMLTGQHVPSDVASEAAAAPRPAIADPGSAFAPDAA